MSTFGDTTTAQDKNTTKDKSTAQENGARDNVAGRPLLRRAWDGRLIAGVCAGLGDYLNIDITIVRVAFAVFTFVGGIGIPAYLACLLLIPEEGSDQSIAAALIDSVQNGR